MPVIVIGCWMTGGGYGGRGGGGGGGGGADHWSVDDPYNAAAARGVMAPYAAAATYGPPNPSGYGAHGSSNWGTGGDDAWD